MVIFIVCFCFIRREASRMWNDFLTLWKMKNMKKYIAIFEAAYPGIDATQYSCITWEQQNDNVDHIYVNDLIKNTTARHFFKAIAGAKANIDANNIVVSLGKIEAFN